MFLSKAATRFDSSTSSPHPHRTLQTRLCVQRRTTLSPIARCRLVSDENSIHLSMALEMYLWDQRSTTRLAAAVNRVRSLAKSLHRAKAPATAMKTHLRKISVATRRRFRWIATLALHPPQASETVAYCHRTRTSEQNLNFA
mmetsp:Transcript_40271/g.91922  ORF Transcript_40271/g.91922 Transcript_40271/m.91922 type:complete len:142 (-) Transcript_40271:259-684(-)